jgi:hypothetical protein
MKTKKQAVKKKTYTAAQCKKELDAAKYLFETTSISAECYDRIIQTAIERLEAANV